MSLVGVFESLVFYLFLSRFCPASSVEDSNIQVFEAEKSYTGQHTVRHSSVLPATKAEAG